MEFKYNTKQRNKTIQGLRSFKDTLPTKIKRIIVRKGEIYSKTLDNWRYIVGNELFKICYPSSFKKYTKQRNGSIQGLRSFKDTLPKNIKKVINKRGQIYSETLNNWKYFVGENLFKICYPKSYKNSNSFTVSTLLIMVKRGHEVDVEYSKKKIIDKINSFFGYKVIEQIKILNFEGESEVYKEKKGNNVTKNNYNKKISSIKNNKIRDSLKELTQLFIKK